MNARQIIRERRVMENNLITASGLDTLDRFVSEYIFRHLIATLL